MPGTAFQTMQTSAADGMALLQGFCAVPLLLGLARDPVTDISNKLRSAESYGPISCTELMLKT